MASKRERVGLILLGIFLGLVVSASFLWWQQHILKKDWFSFRGIRSVYEKLFDSKNDSLTQNQNKNQQTLHPGEGKVNARTDTLDARLDSLLLSDSADISYLVENGALEYYIESGNKQDTLPYYPGEFKRKISRRDTINRDTTLSSLKKRQDDYVVKRDQYLMTKVYNVAGYPDSAQRQNEHLDSLLTNDVRTHRLPSNTIRVEFWKSPINYIGYRLSLNRLVLFGPFNPEDISLEYHNHKFLLRHKNSFYLLEMNNDFQSLVSIKRP